MTNKITKWYAIGLTVLVLVYFIQMAVYPPDYTLSPMDWENIYNAAYEQVMHDYEYHVLLELNGYEVFNEDGDHVGSAAIGDCALDNLFINDNE